MMRRILGLYIVAASLLMVLSAFSGASHVASTTGAASAPLGAPAPAVSAPAALHAAMSASPVHPQAAAPSSPTPRAPCIPHWSGQNFQKDVCVTFWVPGDAAKPSIDYVPFNSSVSQYAVGFYMNISTDQPIAAAILTIWATEWPGGVQGASLNGYDPATVAQGQNVHSMVIGKDNRTAYYCFDIIKYFFPGTTISFNLEVESTVATPGKIWSNQTINVTQKFPSGFINYPSWEIDVGSPWSSPFFDSDIAVSTDPNVISTPAYDPNPGQKLTVTITSISATGGVPNPIPNALIQYTITQFIKGLGTTNSSYSGTFDPDNATVERFTFPQPFPNSQVTFNITGRLPWQGGTGFIDLIVSKEFEFNWSTKGGWWEPTSSLEVNTAPGGFAASPNVLVPGTTHLPTGTRVNVTVHEPIQNVTISSSVVNFQFNDRGALFIGSMPMLRINQNTTYLELPGLPPNATLTFSVTAKDYYNDPVSSGNYTYVENGSLTNSPPLGEGLFFVEVYDVGAQALLSSTNFSAENATWSQNSSTSPMGFGQLLSPGSSAYVFLNDGTYLVTIHVFGESIVRPVKVTSPSPMTIVFYVSSTTVSPQASSPPPPTLQIGGIIGLAAGAVCSYPILVWYKERRARAEAEQRRVTL